MEKDALLPFAFPAVARKKVSVAFDGGMLSSDGGVLLLRNIEKRLGIAERLSVPERPARSGSHQAHGR
jgi:hypothetical protein